MRKIAAFLLGAALIGCDAAETTPVTRGAYVYGEVRRERQPTFAEIRRISREHGYTVVREYNPERESAPTSIIVGTEHNFDNLAVLEELVPRLLTTGGVLGLEGIDDRFENHLAKNQEFFAFDESVLDDARRQYDVVQQHP